MLGIIVRTSNEAREIIGRAEKLDFPMLAWEISNGLVAVMFSNPDKKFPKPWRGLTGVIPEKIRKQITFCSDDGYNVLCSSVNDALDVISYFSDISEKNNK